MPLCHLLNEDQINDPQHDWEDARDQECEVQVWPLPSSRCLLNVSLPFVYSTSFSIDPWTVKVLSNIFQIELK